MSLDSYKSLTPEHKEKILAFVERFEPQIPTLVLIDKIPPAQLGKIISPNDTTERDYIHNTMGIILKKGNPSDLPEDDSMYTDNVSSLNVAQKKLLMAKYNVGDLVVFNIASPQRIMHQDLPKSGVWVMDLSDVYGKYNG